MCLIPETLMIIIRHDLTRIGKFEERMKESRVKEGKEEDY